MGELGKDVIRLNVGGVMMDTKRSTLCQVEGSLLATMFSQLAEDSLDRDENGVIFLDMNPKYFSMILNYLRLKRFARETSNVPPPLPKLKPQHVKPFTELASQLGLEKEQSLDSTSCTFKQHGTWISITDNGYVAEHTGHNRGVGYGLSDSIHHEGVIHWEFRVESIESEMFIGILAADMEPYDDRSYAMEGSYGWLLKVGEDVIGSALNDGKIIYNIIANVKKGDTIELLLNSITDKLSLVIPPVTEFHMFLPNSQGWRLHVNLFRQHDMIRILSL